MNSMLKSKLATAVSLSIAVGSVSVGNSAIAESLIIEEIIVNATRRDEMASTTPVSISALSAEQVDAFRIADVEGLAPSVPNLSIFSVPGNSLSPILNIRGILNRSSDATRDTAVGVYMDDVFLARGYAVLGQMLDVQQVEVLRGPQGTLFGRNTIGGAIQLTSQRAELGGNYDGYARVTAGNYDLKEFRFASGIPLTDTMAARVAFNKTKRDGYTDSYLVDDTFDPASGKFGYVDGVTPAEKINTNDLDNISYRLSYVWEPSDNSRLDFSYYHNEDETNGTFNISADGDLGGNVPGPDPSLPFPQARAVGYSSLSDFHSGVTDVRPFGESEVDIFIAKYSHSFDSGIDMKVIVSRAEAEQSEAFNTDGVVQAAATPPQPFAYEVANSNDGEVEQNTFELQFSGEAEDFEWIGGIYYFEEDARDRNTNQLSSPLAELAGSMLPDPTASPQLIAFTSSNAIDVEAENTSASIYGSVNYSFTDDLLVRFGARYTEDSKGFVGHSTSSTPLIPGVQTCIYTGQPVNSNAECTSKGVIPEEAEFENITWDISFDYTFSADLFGYAKVGTGYRTGGISLNAQDLATAQAFDEDEVLSYELGLKYNIAGTAQVNGSIFYVDYTDIQENVNAASPISCVQTPTTAIITCNVGDAASQGIELDAAWQVTDSLGLKATYGYTDLEFDDPNFSAFYVPEWTYSVSATYDIYIAEMPLRAIVSYEASDDWFNTPDVGTAGKDLAEFDGYSLVNARMILNITDSLEVSVWGKNLTDDEYFSSATAGVTPIFASSTGTPAEPLTYGADFKYSF